MGKIKNQTQKQKEIHNRAVKIRKMSDEELVKHFDAAVTIKRSETPEDKAKLEQMISERLAEISRKTKIDIEKLNPEAVTKTACASGYSTEEFLQALEAANLRGIGKITIKKISEFAKEKGYI